MGALRHKLGRLQDARRAYVQAVVAAQRQSELEGDAPAEEEVPEAGARCADRCPARGAAACAHANALLVHVCRVPRATPSLPQRPRGASASRAR